MKLENKLDKMAEDFCELIKKIANVYIQNNNEMEFEDNSKEFKSLFIEQYKYILNNYMKENDKSLDRHKVAAIVIITIIKLHILKIKNPNEKFTGNYALAIDVALNYMLDEINEILIQKNGQTIEGYDFPIATNCNTEYYRIFYRNLYYIDNNPEWTLNPLDIADRLFLLEYITLLKKDIDPRSVKW